MHPTSLSDDIGHETPPNHEFQVPNTNMSSQQSDTQAGGSPEPTDSSFSSRTSSSSLPPSTTPSPGFDTPSADSVLSATALVAQYRTQLLNAPTEAQADTLLALRRKLTADPSSCASLISCIFETDLPQILLENFAVHSDWKMQFNALICLKELSANPRPGIHSMAIIRTMLDLLDTSNIIEVIEVALVILGHMTQDVQPLRGKYMRHAILNHNVLNRISAILTDSNAQKLIPAVAWLSSTLIEEPMPSNLECVLGDDYILMLLDFCFESDEDTVANSLAALAGIVETYPSSWDLIVSNSEPMARLLGILAHNDQRIVFSALKIFATITSTNDDEILQLLIDEGLITALKQLVDHKSSTIRLWVAFGLSNILAGLAHNVQRVIDIGVVPPLVTMVEYEMELKATQPEATREVQIVLNAACALSNGLANTTDTQVHYFLEQRVLDTIMRILDPELPEYVIDCILSAVMHVLIDGEPLTIVAICLQLEGCNAAEKLRSLTSHANPEIGQNVNELLIAMNTIKFSIQTKKSPPKGKLESTAKTLSQLDL